MKRRKTQVLCLVLLALLLRIPWCSAYPFSDETINFTNISHFFANRTLIPVNTLYPTFFPYLASLPTALVAFFLKLTGTLHSVAELPSLLVLHSSLPLLGGRLTSLTAGLATILVVYRVGETYCGKGVGLMAALFASVSSLQLYFSTSCLADMTTALFATCAIGGSLRGSHTLRLRDLQWAAVFAGLATSTKYNSALVSLPVALAYGIKLRDEGRLFSPRAWAGTDTASLPALFLAAFLFASPGWVLVFGTMWSGFRYNLGVVTARGHSFFYGVPYLGLLYNLWRSEGLLALGFGIGVIFGFYRRDRTDAVLLAGVVPSFLYIGSWKYLSPHYVLFTLPMLGLLAARALNDLGVRFLPSRTAALNPVLLSAAVLVYPLWNATGQAVAHTREDSRWAAHRWIQDHVAEDSLIAVDSIYVPQLLTQEQKFAHLQSKHSALFSSRFATEKTFRVVRVKLEPAWLEQTPAQYLILSSDYYDRFLDEKGPPPGDPRHDEFQQSKASYQTLLREKGTGPWELSRKFDTGHGPKIFILRKSSAAPSLISTHRM